jgi:transcriptional regulator with XRE-family HTH domain
MCSTAQGGTVNEALRRALADARLRETDVATALGVDPKTVQRWLAGRVPHPRHRWAVADLVRRDERELWPDLDFSGPTCPEIKTIYPHRSAVPRELWHRMFANSQREIGILAYAALFLAEDLEFVRLLADKAQSGVPVRLLLASPESPRLAERGEEEGIGTAVGARVQNALALFRPMLAAEGVQGRLHETVLYNSIFRADDDMLINPQVYGVAAAYAPVLHLHHLDAGGGIFETYADSFERIWAKSESADAVERRSIVRS